MDRIVRLVVISWDSSSGTLRFLEEKYWAEKKLLQLLYYRLPQWWGLLMLWLQQRELLAM